jgi:hypothetical protein
MVEEGPVNTNPVTVWRLGPPERLWNWKLLNFWEVFGKKAFGKVLLFYSFTRFYTTKVKS